MTRAHSVSSVRTFRSCKRRYAFEYINRIRPVAGKALQVGSATHGAVEEFDAGKSVEDGLARVDHEASSWLFSGAEVELRRTRAMVRAYFTRWEGIRSHFKVIESEEWFDTELDGHRLCGRADALWQVADLQGERLLVERKTTSEEIETAGSDYWGKLAFDTQVTVYPWEASKRLGIETPKILYDVIRKPAGQPKMKKKVAKRKTETDEQFAERKAEQMESLDEFEERLLGVMLEKPDAYLVRRNVSRTSEQNAEIMAELRDTLEEMDSYQGIYPRNDGACRSKFGLCPFFGVCSGTESLDSERFEKREERPAEVAEPQTTTQPKETQGDLFASCPL